MATRVATARATGETPAAAREIVETLTQRLGGEAPELVVIMASIGQPLGQVAPVVAEAFPYARVIGASTAGEFTQEGPTDSIAAFALAGDVVVHAAMARGLREDAEAAVNEAIRSLPAEAPGYPHKLGLLFVDSYALNGEETTMLAAMAFGDGTPLAGGSAADSFQMLDRAWVSCGAEAEVNALVCAAVFSKTPIGIGVRHGHTPVSDALTVTRSEGAVVYELDGEPAWDVWDRESRRSPHRAQFGDITTPGLDGFNGFVTTFELGFSTGAAFKVRAPLARVGDGGLAFACGIPQGSKVHVMESGPTEQVESARAAARAAVEQLGGRAPTGGLVVDCACRKVLLGERLGEAVAAIGAVVDAPFAGFESYGEIALQAGEMSGFHNTTSVVVLFS